MKISVRLLAAAVSLFLCCAAASASISFDGVKGLVARRVPSLAGKVEFYERAAAPGYADTYELSVENGKLIVKASSQTAASMAVNWYLNIYCHESLSHNGDNAGGIDGKLPETGGHIVKNSRFGYRYALNYCTYNYSYSFYDWNDWERELDWMALHGVNLMLAPLGCELVWANVLRQYGFSDAEIENFVAGPGYTAWWLMGNLQGWGGPMSRDMMESRADMQRRIMARMKELGIEPVLQGFWGMVPTALAEKYPSAKIADQGMWGRVFQRPAVLLPDDPLFSKMADSWYAELKSQYGNDIKYLGGDLFHEGGDTTGVNVTRTARLIQESMQHNLPGSIWMLQGWSGNPKKELLAGLSPEHTIVIDLFGESGTTWRDTHEFYGTPWVWATVNHFGGKTDMGGQLPVIIKGPHQALQASSGLLCGVGILPEGINANPVVYDWAMKTAWEDSEPSVADYTRDYIRYRYGKDNADLMKAWDILTRSIYGDFEIKGEGTFESIFCARPGMEVKNVSTWGPKRFQYDPEDVKDALKLFIAAAPEFRGSVTFSYDLADLARQVLANHAREVYDRSMAVYRNGDAEGFSILADEFISLLKLQDRLAGTQPEWLVGRWLDKASHYGNTVEDCKLSEKNARMLITYWGPEIPSTRIHDYANKEWNGLLEDYYLPRWEAFYSWLKKKMAGEDAAEPDYFAIEKGWVYNRKAYPVSVNGEDVLHLADTVMLAARPAYRDKSLSAEARAADLLSRMTLSEKVAQMRHLHFKHFDTDGHVDMEKLAASSGGHSWGCIEAFPYSSGQYMRAMYRIQKYMREETRLGIPVIPVMEGLHGVVQDGSTVFPQAIAQGATFSPELVGQMAGCIAGEMSAIGAEQVLAPDLDVVRELRWGRVEETYGEDPYLISCMGNAYMAVMHENGKITTPKHFLAHGNPVGGLNLASVRGGERELRDLYLVPFKSVIQNQSPLSIMNCYSSYDGVAVTGSPYYMTDMLRGELGFRGYVYSDWGSVRMLAKFHMAAASNEEAAKMAVEAGIDLEAGSENYRFIEDMVRSGKIDMNYIDRAAGNVLYAKFASGLFDKALPDTLGWQKGIHTPEARVLARRMADESTVLLTNNDGFLPLSADALRSVAVIGPNSDRVQLGDYSWGADKNCGVTPLEGIRSMLDSRGVRVNYAAGCDPYSQDRSGFKAAVSAARKSDVILLFVGSQSAMLARASEPATSGEGYDLTDLVLPGVQMDLVRELAKLGKPMVVTMVTGKPFVADEIASLSKAVLVQWYAGEEAGNSIASILFGDMNPSGKLPVSFPKSVGHLPCYYNYLPTDKGYYNKKGSIDKPGRDYVFSDPYASYSFGHGLSYTTFEYGNLAVRSDELAPGDTINVKFTVKNTGSVDGKAVPQLYVRDKVSSVATPVKQLKAFTKILLKAGEQKTVELNVPVSALSLHDKSMREVVEPGEFELYIGDSSEDIRLNASVTVGDGFSEASSVNADVRDAVAGVEAHGEYVEISGTVRNVQAAVLSGVTVSPAGEPSVKTVTDRNGRYRIRVRLNDSLVFTLDSYIPVSVPVKGTSSIDVDMDPLIN
mgnify:CR=1 FL=1